MPITLTKYQGEPHPPSWSCDFSTDHSLSGILPTQQQPQECLLSQDYAAHSLRLHSSHNHPPLLPQEHFPTKIEEGSSLTILHEAMTHPTLVSGSVTLSKSPATTPRLGVNWNLEHVSCPCGFTVDCTAISDFLYFHTLASLSWISV